MGPAAKLLKDALRTTRSVLGERATTQDIRRVLERRDTHSLKTGVGRDPQLDQAIDRLVSKLVSMRRDEGSHWFFELESNDCLGAEYIMFMHMIGQPGDEHIPRIVKFLLARQGPDGGWALYPGGPSHLSASVLIYFGLKLAGQPEGAAHMKRLRTFIRERGGMRDLSVEARFLLALFGQYPWESLPPIPPWMVLLPKQLSRVGLNIYDIAYWARISLVPMSVLYHFRARYPLPDGCTLDELYLEPPHARSYPFTGKSPDRSLFTWAFSTGSMAVKRLEKNVTGPVLGHVALKKAEAWILAHQDTAGDWGGIYPPMMYSVLALRALDPVRHAGAIKRGIEAARRLVWLRDDGGANVLACTSPVWDTAWTVFAMNEAGVRTVHERAKAVSDASSWLFAQQILRDGDWSIRNPSAIPGGWCFQYYNDLYPDCDDTAVVLMALRDAVHGAGSTVRAEAYRIGLQWLMSMQNKDGGWSAFEKGVDKRVVKHLPFNDLNNMLDPSTEDVTGRCLELLGMLGLSRETAAVQRGIDFVRARQLEDGSWWGRWGVNFVYGTWSVVRGLAAVGIQPNDPALVRAAKWMKTRQNTDGGFGESCASYDEPAKGMPCPSTPSQTAWGLMALISCGESSSPEAKRAAGWLLANQRPDGGFDEPSYTGTGFPGAFYLGYGGYRYYFPLLALGRYRTVMAGA